MAQLDHAPHPGLIGAQPAPRPDVADKARLYRREGGFPTLWLIAPATLWLFLFLVVPLLSIVVFSFWKNTGFGMEAAFTLDAYAEYFESEGFFDPAEDKFLTPSIFLKTLFSTFRFTVIVMFFCLLLGYPIAYFLALQVKAFKPSTQSPPF